MELSTARVSRLSRGVCACVWRGVCLCGGWRARAPLARPSRPLRPLCLSPLSSVCVCTCVSTRGCVYIYYFCTRRRVSRVCVRAYMFLCVCMCARERHTQRVHRQIQTARVCVVSLSRIYCGFSHKYFIVHRCASTRIRSAHAHARRPPRLTVCVGLDTRPLSGQHKRQHVRVVYV